MTKPLSLRQTLFSGETAVIYEVIGLSVGHEAFIRLGLG